MGVEVGKSHYGSEDFAEFKRRLRKETSILLNWLDSSQGEKCNEHMLGLELEAWIVDRDAIPAPDNHQVLELVNDPLLVAELSRFNLELNAPPVTLGGPCFAKLQDNLVSLWRNVQNKSASLNRRLLMIGTLPTLRDEMLAMEYMSDMDRYRAINERVFALKNQQAMTLQIAGLDDIDVSHQDIMLEAATTSFQIHLQTPHDDITRTFNASLACSFAVIAAGANSPFLFGKSLWHESRIPIFEQALDVAAFTDKHGDTQRRVTFGSDYLRKSMAELFLENLERYEILLPECYDKHTDWLSHLRLHNGNIWRWNRPIVGMSKNLTPSLRIEQRVLPAGPTTVDMIANMAFYTGLCCELSQWADLTTKLPFADMKRNFYSCARNGLDAKVTWQGAQSWDVQNLILEKLLPMARAGLEKLAVDTQDIKFYLDEIMTQRVRSGQNGAKWQRSWVDLKGYDFQGLVDTYFHLQEKGLPVHEWRV